MSFRTKSLTSMLQHDVQRQNQQHGSTTNLNASTTSSNNNINNQNTIQRKRPSSSSLSKEDSRRVVVHFRLFVVLRPPSLSFDNINNKHNNSNPYSPTTSLLLANSSLHMNPQNMRRLAEIQRLTRNARKVDLFGNSSSSNSAATFANMLHQASSSSNSGPNLHSDPYSRKNGAHDAEREHREKMMRAAEADGDEDNITRDLEADDEADAIWDQYSIGVIPFVMTVTLGVTTVDDVLEKAWPYVVELWRDQGRFWHKNMVPTPLPQASEWFALRMIGKRWHDPSRPVMRNCLEPPVPTLLSGYNFSGFEHLQTSLTSCSFQERALVKSTLIKKLLPEDPDAHLKMMRGGSLMARFLSGVGSSGAAARYSNSGVSSAVHGGLSGEAKRRRDAEHAHKAGTGSLPRFRMSCLLTLSTEFILLEHLCCCETKTREAIMRTIDNFFDKMKTVEMANFDCAVKRTLHRQRIEKLFADLVAAEEFKRTRMKEMEGKSFWAQIRSPYEESMKTLLPVMKEAHAIRVAWREKLAQDMENEKKKIKIERRRERRKLTKGDEDEDDFGYFDDDEEDLELYNSDDDERNVNPSCNVD